MISGSIEVNQFTQILVILEEKFIDDAVKLKFMLKAIC